MTSQSYYKDVLGFDPNEGQYESSTTTTTRRTGTRHQHHHHHQQYLHNTSGSSNNGGVGGHHSHHTHHSHHRSQHQHHHQTSTSASPARISISPGGASLDHYADSSPAAKKAKHPSTLQQPQGGYEDALTQFKGTMSMWEYFIENWDIIRKSIRFSLSFPLGQVQFGLTLCSLSV